MRPHAPRTCNACVVAQTQYPLPLAALSPPHHSLFAHMHAIDNSAHLALVVCNTAYTFTLLHVLPRTYMCDTLPLIIACYVPWAWLASPHPHPICSTRHADRHACPHLRGSLYTEHAHACTTMLLEARPARNRFTARHSTLPLRCTLPHLTCCRPHHCCSPHPPPYWPSCHACFKA